MPFRPILALGLLLFVAAPSAAQEGAVPMCLAQREGMAACFGEKLCLCRYDPGGTLTGRPPGWRWDCGPLRPACGVVPPNGGSPSLQMAPPMVVQPYLDPREMARPR